jgi:hypothetical protein
MQSVLRRLLAVTACFATAAPAFADDSFRCGSRLIVTGMTQSHGATRVLMFDQDVLKSNK